MNPAFRAAAFRGLILVTPLALFLTACLLEELESLIFFEVSTFEPISPELGTVTFEGRIRLPEGEAVDVERHGFLWSDSLSAFDLSTPGVNRIDLGPNRNDPDFDTTLQGLRLSPPLYHVRAFAQKGERIQYGEIKMFTFRDFVVGAPQVSGIVNDTLFLRSLLFGLERRGEVSQRGHVFATNPNDTFPVLGAANFTQQGPSNDDEFFFDTLKLDFNRAYWLRTYATFNGETIYSDESVRVPIGGGWNWRGISFPTINQVRNPMGVVLNKTFYVGLACDKTGGCGVNQRAIKDLWKITPFLPDGGFERVTEFPGNILITNGLLFAIEEQQRIYYGIGENTAIDGSPVYLNQLWSFAPDAPAGQQWRQEADFPGTGRSGAVAFVVDGKAYIGSGKNETNDIETFLSDFWEFDPESTANPWRPVASLPRRTTPGGPDLDRGRTDASAWSHRGVGYVGTGLSLATTALADIWSFDPSGEGSWSFHSFFPDPRYDCGVLTIGDSLTFMGFGIDEQSDRFRDWYRFEPGSSDVWQAVPGSENFPAPARQNPFAVGLNGRGYLGGGRKGASGNDQLQDIWEYYPARKE